MAAIIKQFLLVLNTPHYSHKNSSTVHSGPCL